MTCKKVEILMFGSVKWILEWTDKVHSIVWFELLQRNRDFFGIIIPFIGGISIPS